MKNIRILGTLLLALTTGVTLGYTITVDNQSGKKATIFADYGQGGSFCLPDIMIIGPGEKREMTTGGCCIFGIAVHYASPEGEGFVLKDRTTGTQVVTTTPGIYKNQSARAELQGKEMYNDTFFFACRGREVVLKPNSVEVK